MSNKLDRSDLFTIAAAPLSRRALPDPPAMNPANLQRDEEDVADERPDLSFTKNTAAATSAVPTGGECPRLPTGAVVNAKNTVVSYDAESTTPRHQTEPIAHALYVEDAYAAPTSVAPTPGSGSNVQPTPATDAADISIASFCVAKLSKCRARSVAMGTVVIFIVVALVVALVVSQRQSPSAVENPAPSVQNPLTAPSLLTAPSPPTSAPRTEQVVSFINDITLTDRTITATSAL
jgi:hypothetical protein